MSEKGKEGPYDGRPVAFQLQARGFHFRRHLDEDDAMRLLLWALQNTTPVTRAHRPQEGTDGE